MYSITIKNFYQSGTLIKDETLLFTVPIQQDQIDNVLTDPSVSCELGKTGTFEFTIYPNHPYYHSLAQMRTIMRVEYDGDTIFRGRVLTIDNTMKGAKKVHCEGDMAFLLDSYQMGSKKESRPSKTLNAYINEILAEHNRQMMEENNGALSGKEIYPGYIPGAYPSSITSAQQIKNESDQFGSNSAEQTMNALESLTKEFGGFFRTRYSAADQKTYLDWCRLWFREDSVSSQPIAISQNLIDVNSNSEVDNIFTAVIPIGSNKGEDVFITGYRTDIHGDNNRILVPQITKVYTESQLDNGYVNKSIYERAVKQYGIIYKVQKFSNADTQEKLWTYACDWIKNNYVGGITSYDLSAVDMHHVDNTVVKYLAGDCVNLTIHSDMTELDEYNPDKQSNTIRRTLLGVKYDLYHPEKNKYTAGIPSDILNLEYGTASTSKSGKGGSGAKAGGGKKSSDNEKREQEAREEAQEALAWKLVWDETRNNEKYNAVKEKYPAWKGMNQAMLDTAHMVVHRVLNDPEIDTPEEVASIVMSGEKARIALMAPASKIMELSKKTAPPQMRKYLDRLDKSLEDINEANTVVAMDAAMKALTLKGKNDDTVDKAVKKIASINLPEGATADDYRKAVEDSLKDLDLPKDVVKLTTNKDSSGNEAGLFQMAKEAVVNTQLNSGGNDGKGTAEFGKADGKWLIQMNKPLQYSMGGKTYTLPDGTIDSQELSMLRNTAKPIPSFSTKFAEIDEAIIGRATIVDLNAAKANITSLTTKVANIENVISNVVTTQMLAAGFTMTGDLQANGKIITSNLTFKGKTIQIIDQVVMTSATGSYKQIHYLGYPSS